MNKSNFVALFVALLGLAAAAPAAAQMSFYFGGSVGNTEAHQDACQDAQFGCDRSDTAYAGHVGFMFSPNWGIEVTGRNMGKVVERTFADGGTALWKSKAVDAVVVAALPFSQIGLGDRLAIYGKAGGYYARTNVESSSTEAPNAERTNRQWTYGVGVSFDVFKWMRLRAEWQRYNNLGASDVGMRADVNVLSGGAVIVF
jgi:opacity protein-like surface antigen